MSYPTVSFDVSSLTPYIPSPRGAQLGRDEWGVVGPETDNTLYAATWIALYGDYDKGGVYWGRGGQSVYCVHTVESDDFRQFTRADSADAAFDAFGIPNHLRVTFEIPPLTFDVDAAGNVDVAPILEMFDDGQLYPSEVDGRYGTGPKAFVTAQSVVEGWVFTPGLYEAVGRWWANISSGDDDDGPVTEQTLRAIFLQEIAHKYDELEQYGNDLDDRDEEYDTPLEMLRAIEWSDDRECPVDLFVCGGKIYYCFSG